VTKVRGRLSRRLHIAVLVGACLVPLAFFLPALGDPYGTSEDGLNPALWGLGARNLLAGGVASQRGARVSPYPGTTGNGIYAHHPPLPVWVMTVPVALGGWEGWARLIALGCAAASLGLLYRVLRRSFEPRVALAAVVTISLSGFLLECGRLFNTLTLATPLFLVLLDVTLGALKGERCPRWTPGVAALLVLSSWDGVIGAGVLVGVLLLRARAWPTALGALGALAFVGWHLIDATGGTAELQWQLGWRAGGSEFTALQWLSRQGELLGFGLGPLTLALLFGAPVAWAVARQERAALWTLLLAATPGVLMLLVFRQGAHRHSFWGYNLVLPAAVALAMALTFALRAGRRPVAVLLGCLGLQAAGSAYVAGEHLRRGREANQVGALVARRFATGVPTVPMLTHYNYHPYVSWYARARPDWALTREELDARVADGRWAPQAQVLVDAHYTTRLGCRPYRTLDATGDGRWVAVRADELQQACRR